ncbi:MAG: trypsin-like peptidase domain-containing protein, partial [Acetobacteraceae bacterium]|nr:trypsin-like peptidase domain-containing protein [Acetobacteraceae bacterium]
MWHVLFGGRPAIVVGLCLAALLAPTARAQEMQFNQAQLVRSLLPTVVNITAHAAVGATGEVSPQSVRETKQQFEIKTAVGSGFVIDPSGIVATNWHVVDGAYEIFVTFSDGARVNATVMGAARVVDIALL